jgi:tetratricopeptide (TPR) repeat protein
VADLQKAIEIDGKDLRAMDQLGVIFSALDRPEDAERTLRRALSIRPDDPDVLLHLGRALMELGREAEADEFLRKFETLRPQRARGPWRQAGMIESATLSSTERVERQIQRLRGEASAHPDDPELRLRFASLLATDGRVSEATTEFRVLMAGNADSQIWEQAGTFLLGLQQYELASQFLRRAAAVKPSAFLDLAIALFFFEGPAKALEALEQVPPPNRSADYLVLRASMLDASGQSGEAEQILEHGASFSISRPQIAQQAVLWLLQRHREQLALDILDKATGSNPELRLTRAIVLGVLQRVSEAEKVLRDIEVQWPEWDRPYLAHGLLLQRLQPREATLKLRTAVALAGPQASLARCLLSRIGIPPALEGGCSCVVELRDLLFAACSRP